jgi:hypothetical protein
MYATADLDTAVVEWAYARDRRHRPQRADGGQNACADGKRPALTLPRTRRAIAAVNAGGTRFHCWVNREPAPTRRELIMNVRQRADSLSRVPQVVRNS